MSAAWEDFYDNDVSLRDAPEPPPEFCSACGDVVGETPCECHAPPSQPERLEMGWLMEDGRYVCDGCAVRPGHMHRCHRGDGAWADPRQVCTCAECVEAR